MGNQLRDMIMAAGRHGWRREQRQHDEEDHGRVAAAELRGEVQVLRPLRGSAGAHITAGAAEEEEEEARPWQQGGGRCCHWWEGDAGLLR